MSWIIRRLHLFTGLFLGPWMLMYALSTLVMAHRDFVFTFYPSKSPAMKTERELDYAHSFSDGTDPEQMGRQILRDLELDGAHAVSGGKDGRPIVIDRRHALSARRITFNPSTQKVVIQREEFLAATILERLHRRRGYNQPYLLDDTWGFTVDVAVAAMVFWSLSGIWLWWELKATRKWGALALISGPALFVLFLILI